MIVTVGKIVKIDTGRFLFVSDCNAPGKVTVKDSRGTIDLPGNRKEADEFIRAYLRVVDEPIEYTSGNCE